VVGTFAIDGLARRIYCPENMRQLISVARRTLPQDWEPNFLPWRQGAFGDGGPRVIE
jgi:hypothetical protein